jgi:hypothetical protein
MSRNPVGRCAWEAESRNFKIIQAVRIPKLRGMIVALYRSGQTCAAIGRALRCSSSSVRKQLRIAEEPRRTAARMKSETCGCGRPRMEKRTLCRRCYARKNAAWSLAYWRRKKAGEPRLLSVLEAAQ